MEWLNDIKVYDDVLDQPEIENIYDYLKTSFYTLQRTNDTAMLERSKKFLKYERTEHELAGFMETFTRDQMRDALTDYDLKAEELYWTRIHKGAPESTKEDEELCEALYGALTSVCDAPPYEVLGNVYTNMLRCMDRPKAHIDNIDAKNRTVMFYTNREWHRDWGGETVFFDYDDNIIKAVAPKPGRVVSFDGRIPHSARAPQTSAYVPRYITVMKF